MFESVDWRGLRFVRGASRYVAQLVFSYPAAMLASLPVTSLLAGFGFSGDRGPGIHFAGYEILACLLLGTSVGWAVGRFQPSWVRTGQWIWIVPVMIVGPDFLRQIHHLSLAYLPGYFFATGGNEGLEVYLFTLPTCAAAGYSLGMILLSLNARWPAATRLRSVGRFAALWLIAGAGLGWLGFRLHDFERETFERRANIRRVISTAQVSPDPQLFCVEYRPSRKLDLLPAGTVVLKLERRACNGNQLVDAATAPPHGKDHYSLVGVEKIRVMEGIDTGLEGWVLVAGLSNPE